MLDYDKLEADVKGAPGDTLAVPKAALLEMITQGRLGNTARNQLAGLTVVERFQEAMA